MAEEVYIHTLVYQSMYVMFSLIPFLQIPLISSLPGAKLVTLGNLIYEHYKKKKKMKSEYNVSFSMIVCFRNLLNFNLLGSKLASLGL